MGFESRDYSRDGSYTRSFQGLNVDFTPVVKTLLLINVVVFLLQIFITRPAELRDFAPALPEEAREQWEERMRPVLRGKNISVVQEWLELKPSKTVPGGQVWRVITCAFCHDRLGVWHIVFNMLLLYWFGTRLERQYGSREFLLFYLAAALCSSLAFLGLAFYTSSDIPAIGASGAVMGVMILYTIFHPHETILIFFVIPVPLWMLMGLYVIFDLHPVLLALAGERQFTGVAHAGHLGGLVFGALYWKWGGRLESLFERAPRLPRRKPRVKLYQPPDPEPDFLADRVDEVLKKISEQGKESLTDAEREILIRASTRYRARE